MKRSPELQQVAARMAPGALTRDGFLGTDPRRIEEILDTDNSTVSGLGTTHEAIADALADIMQRAKAELGRPVPIGEHVTAVHQEAMGRMPSPWPGEGVFEKGEVDLTDATGDTLRITALGVDLIAAHGFYQGRGSRYRIEPAQVCRMLGIGRRP